MWEEQLVNPPIDYINPFFNVMAKGGLYSHIYSGSITVPYKYKPQAGFEPGTYGILST